ncbi:unnamed protein product [Oppiella nova]|uniref:PB1 domain-containing protein n=1 Tax=Oppiella nova TaxID=334625 RepID=A0A7R9QYT6_9ACAR|nr:unnamed protein product [Oppiella nova]CAG2179431.1 unnamed protein product [Oppiella nova]
MDTELIRVKAAFNGQIMVIYIKDDIYLNDLCSEMRDICRFGSQQSFTMKWVDEEVMFDN